MRVAPPQRSVGGQRGEQRVGDRRFDAGPPHLPGNQGTLIDLRLLTGRLTTQVSGEQVVERPDRAPELE
jgi:hypothetical protein